MTETFVFPTWGERREQALLLAIDDYSLPLKKTVSYLSSPRCGRNRCWCRAATTPRRPTMRRPSFTARCSMKGAVPQWYYALHRSESRA